MEFIWGLTHPHVIKEDGIAFNYDWVYDQACRLSRGIHVMSHSLITFDYILDLSGKTRLSFASLEFLKYIIIKRSVAEQTLK